MMPPLAQTESYRERLADLQDTFNRFAIKIEYDQWNTDGYRQFDAGKAAQDVCNLYFEQLDFFRGGINPAGRELDWSKMVSGTELAIMRVLPLTAPELTEAVLVNARLAFFTAFSQLLGYHEQNSRFRYVENWEFFSRKNQLLREFYQEHVYWLKQVPILNEYPYLPNAHAWRLFYQLLTR